MQRGLALALALFPACHFQKSDSAAQAAAILHQPSSFTQQLIALDTLAYQESRASENAPPTALAETLSEQATHLKPLVASARSDSEKVEILTAWIFDSLKIVSLTDDPSLSASLPSQVFITRRGSCLGLTLVYLALGHSLDLPLAPVFLPGNIFVRFHSTQYIRNVETLRRGLARTDSFYQDRFSLEKRPWYSLRDADTLKALGALVFNLGNEYRLHGDWKTAAQEFRLAEEILPGFPEALGNQGAALLESGQREAAKKKFLAALAGDSLATPAWKNLALIYKAEGNSEKEIWAERGLAELGQPRNLQATDTGK
jgi:regulator of sirC expression with transglutaminase-like and TPR domain